MKKRFLSMFMAFVIILSAVPDGSGITNKTSAASAANELAAEVVRLINIERTNAGLGALSEDYDALNNAAATRAVELTVKFEYIRPDGREWRTVLDDYGIAAVDSEHIGGKRGTPNEIIQYLKSDSKLWEIITKSNYTHIGADAAQDSEDVFFWALILIQSSSAYLCENGHDWTSWSQKTPATCTSGNKEEMTCRRNCGVVPLTRVTIDALGHSRKTTNCKECSRCNITGLAQNCTKENPCTTHAVVINEKGRILDKNKPPSIFDALEILKYIIKMPNVISKAGEGSREWNAALIVPNAAKPSIFDVLEIIKYIAYIPSRIDPDPKKVKEPPPPLKPNFWHDDGHRVGYWNKKTLIVSAGTVGTVSPAFKLGTRVGESLGQWNKVLSTEFNTNSSANANINVYGGRLAALKEAHGSWPPNAAGLCEWNVERTSTGDLKPVGEFTFSGAKKSVYIYTMARIYVVQKSADDSWSNENINLTKTVMTHEFGHALGYFGHVPANSENNKDVMWWQEQTNFTLRDKEKRHLKQIYDYYRK